MKKSEMKNMFESAKKEKAAYVAVLIQTEGESKPEIIINSGENIESKLKYYMEAYDDDLKFISEKKEKDIRMIGVAQGNSLEEIEYLLIPHEKKEWKKIISNAIEKTYQKIIQDTPPEDEKEAVECEMMKEAIKGMMINEQHTPTEEKFICDHIELYEHVIETSMRGDDLEFKKGLVEIQRLQNEAKLKEHA